MRAAISVDDNYRLFPLPGESFSVNDRQQVTGKSEKECHS